MYVLLRLILKRTVSALIHAFSIDVSLPAAYRITTNLK